MAVCSQLLSEISSTCLSGFWEICHKEARRTTRLSWVGQSGALTGSFWDSFAAELQKLVCLWKTSKTLLARLGPQCITAGSESQSAGHVKSLNKNPKTIIPGNPMRWEQTVKQRTRQDSGLGWLIIQLPRHLGCPSLGKCCHQWFWWYSGQLKKADRKWLRVDGLRKGFGNTLSNIFHLCFPLCLWTRVIYRKINV